MSQSDTIPVFPLNAHILPGGKMRLRIFEPRYLRMVRENVSAEPAFAMAMQGLKKTALKQGVTQGVITMACCRW